MFNKLIDNIKFFFVSDILCFAIQEAVKANGKKNILFCAKMLKYDITSTALFCNNSVAIEVYFA